MPAAIDVKTRTKICVLRESGLSLRQIVKQAGVCKSTVQKVITEENLQKGILMDSLRKSSAQDSAQDSAQNIQSEHRVATQAAQTAACTVAELAYQRAQERIDGQQELETQRTCALIDIEAEMDCGTTRVGNCCFVGPCNSGYPIATTHNCFSGDCA